MNRLYRCFDSAGVLLYVGASIAVLSRLEEHRDTKSWFVDVARVEITKYRSRFAVRAAELRVIRDEHPLYNLPRNAPTSKKIEVARRKIEAAIKREQQRSKAVVAGLQTKKRRLLERSQT